MSVGDDGGSEGDGARTAEPGQTPAETLWPADSGNGFDGDHESDGPDGGAELGCQSWCPAWWLVGCG